MTAADIDTAFAEAIAAWDQRIQCDLNAVLGRPCKRAANWRVQQHGCADFLMCTQHLNAHFLNLAKDSFTEVGWVRCRYCRTKFTTIDAIITAVRL